MPELDIQNSSYPDPDPDLHIQNVVNVLGVMLYPDNEEYRKIFDPVFYQELSKPFLEKNIPQMPLNDLNLISRKAELPQRKRRRLMGLNVGYSLSIILRCRQHHPPWASKATAFTIVEYELIKLYKGPEIKKSKGRETLKNQWKQMSPAAHLWAAWRDFNEDQWVLPHYFREFLALAEIFREMGENQYAPIGRLPLGKPIKKQYRKPILDPSLTWRVPNNFTLPKISTPVLPRLPDELIGILSADKKL